MQFFENSPFVDSGTALRAESQLLITNPCMEKLIKLGQLIQNVDLAISWTIRRK